MLTQQKVLRLKLQLRVLHTTFTPAPSNISFSGSFGNSPRYEHANRVCSYGVLVSCTRTNYKGYVRLVGSAPFINRASSVSVAEMKIMKRLSHPHVIVSQEPERVCFGKRTGYVVLQLFGMMFLR